MAPCLEFGCVLRVRPVRYQRDSIRQLSRALPNANTILQAWEKSSSIESILNYSPALPAIWWQVIPVLVLKQSDWPSQDGSTGITSYKAIQAAEAAGAAVQAPSNFFLFFSSTVPAGMKM